jgi:hypothetical protein
MHKQWTWNLKSKRLSPTRICLTNPIPFSLSLAHPLLSPDLCCDIPLPSALSLDAYRFSSHTPPQDANSSDSSYLKGWGAAAANGCQRVEASVDVQDRCFSGGSGWLVDGDGSGLLWMRSQHSMKPTGAMSHMHPQVTHRFWVTHWYVNKKLIYNKNNYKI